MKHCLWISALLCSLTSVSQPINPLVGDQGYISKYGQAPTASTPEFVQIQAHFEYVSSLLRQNTSPDLSPELLAQRDRMIQLLDDYSRGGQFPRNFERPDRRPCFIDPQGTICAVGYLVEQTAGRGLAEEINASYQYDYIQNMCSDELTAWVKQSGLTLEECAMIQPTYGPTTYPATYASSAGEGFSEYMSNSISWRPDGIDSVQTHFTIKANGKTTNVRAEGRHRDLVSQVKRALEDVRFNPARRSDWMGGGGSTNISEEASILMIFNNPADSVLIPQRLDARLLGLGEDERPEDNVMVRVKLKHDSATIGWAAARSISGQAFVTVGDSTTTYSIHGGFSFPLSRDQTGQQTPIVRISCPMFREIVITNMPLTEQEIEIELLYHGRLSLLPYHGGMPLRQLAVWTKE